MKNLLTLLLSATLLGACNTPTPIRPEKTESPDLKKERHNLALLRMSWHTDSFKHQEAIKQAEERLIDLKQQAAKLYSKSREIDLQVLEKYTQEVEELLESTAALEEQGKVLTLRFIEILRLEAELERKIALEEARRSA